MRSVHRKVLNKIIICVIGPEKPYPAFDSVLFTLKEILGSKHVMELRVKNKVAKAPLILKPFYILLEDLMLCFKILSYYKKCKINTVLMFQRYHPITCIGIKISRIRLLLYLGGSAFEDTYYRDTSILNRFLAYSNILLGKICHIFSDTIIMPSEKMIAQLNFRKHANKVRSAIGIINMQFFDKFKILKDYKKRKNVIGYVGRLARGKGILNLVESISFITNKFNDRALRFLIIGTGEYYNNLKDKIVAHKLTNYVSLMGYCSYQALPKYYNEMKLLVLPSYTEGLPSVIIEAMACGTPVLATPVGAIPDIIKNGETGFLLESNCPKHIASKIIELLSKPELLEKVSKNAYEYVRENFNYEKTLQAWRKIISEPEAQK